MYMQGSLRNTHSPPYCPPFPPDYLDNWIPVTPLSQMAATEYDVLIIGSGAGGGSMLWRLCDRLGRSRKRIGIIERGGTLLQTNADNIPTIGGWQRKIRYYYNPRVSFPVSGMPGARQCFALGGRSIFWSAVTPRFAPFVFDSWPITYKELESYYNIAEQVMGVGQNRTTLTDRMLNRLWENGFPEAQAVPAAVSGTTPTVTFSSIDFLGMALRSGAYDLAINTRAVQILTNHRGVVGVVAATPDKQTYLIRCKNLVVSGSTFETPRLLLYSGIPGRAIGHYLANHSYVYSSGILRNGLCEQTGAFLLPQTEGRPYQIQLHADETVDINLFGYVEPRFENHISLNPADVDEMGIPRIHTTFSYSAQDLEVIQAMAAAVPSISGLLNIDLTANVYGQTACIYPPGRDYHESGTCRMGEDPLTSATDRNGQIHGIPGLYIADNSILPSMGASNPTLTTIALAIRTADYISNHLV